ncbi:MAG: hypothetical protein K0Q81_1382, partial [Paenibacillus sp.]|nr:hypothetical protein [Paenibacillus sp.]
MSFRTKRIVLLSTVALLLTLSIVDIFTRKEEMFQLFNDQFFNEQKTAAYHQAHKGVTATSRQQLEINRKDIKEVALASAGGKVTVKRADHAAIRLQYEITATGANTDAANRRRDAVQVTEEMNEGRLTLVTKVDGKTVDPDSVTIEYVLSVPDAVKVKIDNDEGEVRISGIKGDVEASSDRGSMEIVDVRGNLSASSSYGSLYLSDIMGRVELKNNYSYVNADHIEGAVALNGRAGNTFLNRIAGDVTAETNNGAIHLREITGSVTLASQASDLQLDRILGDMSITAEAGTTILILPANKGYKLDAAVSG